MKKNIIKMSLIAAMLLTSGAYAAQIIGATVGDLVEDKTQFGFTGWNLDNINVNMVTGVNNTPIVGDFNHIRRVS